MTISPDPTPPGKRKFAAIRGVIVRAYWWITIPLMAVVFWPTTVYPLPGLSIKLQLRLCTPFAAALIVVTHIYMQEKKDMAKWKQFVLGFLAALAFLALYLGLLGESLMK